MTSEEFLTELLSAEKNALNKLHVGKQLLREALKKNPNMTSEEWEKTKSDFLMFATLKCLKDIDPIRTQFAEILYNELKNE